MPSPGVLLQVSCSKCYCRAKQQRWERGTGELQGNAHKEQLPLFHCSAIKHWVGGFLPEKYLWVNKHRNSCWVTQKAWSRDFVLMQSLYWKASQRHTTVPAVLYAAPGETVASTGYTGNHVKSKQIYNIFSLYTHLISTVYHGLESELIPSW